MRVPYYPRPVLAFGYCRCLRLYVCVRLCVNHKFVRAITHHTFQLGSANLDHRCKRPWLRYPLCLRVIDLDLQGQISLQSQNLPHFELVRDNSSPVQVRTTKFGPEVQNTLVKIPVVLGVDWTWHVKFNLFSKSCLFASLLRLWNICEICKNIWKRSLFHNPNGCAQICSPTTSCHGPWNSRVGRLVMDFWCSCRLSPNYK